MYPIPYLSESRCASIDGVSWLRAVRLASLGNHAIPQRVAGAAHTAAAAAQSATGASVLKKYECYAYVREC